MGVLVLVLSLTYYIWRVLYLVEISFRKCCCEFESISTFLDAPSFFFIHKCMAFSNVGNLVETTFTKNANKNNQIWYAYSIPIVKVRLGSSVSLSVFSASGAWCLYVLLNSERESWRDMEQPRIMVDIFNMLYTVKCYLWQLQ